MGVGVRMRARVEGVEKKRCYRLLGRKGEEG